jgi:ATP-dependent DNA ligase
MLANVPLADDEQAAVDDGQAALDRLLERLIDVPTPDGATPREGDRKTAGHQIRNGQARHVQDQTRASTDRVVAGYQVHKSGSDAIASLLLGLYKDDGTLASVDVIGAFPMAKRWQFFSDLQPLVTTFDDHPWNWAAHEAGERTPRKNEGSRWNAGKDLSFVPLRPETVVEVRYDHMEGERFRHPAQFNRWRPDRDRRSCTYDQLEHPLTFSLSDIVPGLG